MAAEMLTCGSCGDSFDLPAAVRAKYPNWTPRQCMRCRDAGRGAPGSASKSAKRSVTATTNLPLAEVLLRFEGGPADGIFTDGSCAGNPGPGGWGAVNVRDGRVIEQRYGADPATTNNRMEFTAMIEGLLMAPPDEPVTIYTDSALVVNTLRKWAAGWEKRGWKRKEGEVKNLELVQRAFALLKERPHVRLEWIRAHDGSRWNEYADALSTAYLRSEL